MHEFGHNAGWIDHSQVDNSSIIGRHDEVGIPTSSGRQPGIMTARETPANAPSAHGKSNFGSSFLNSNGVIDATKRANPNSRDIGIILDHRNILHYYINGIR